MPKLKKYNLAGEQVGEVALEDNLVNATANMRMIKEYITAILANQRQWSANTKGRSEINHSNKKPHPQKGTGRARQGFLGSPQYKGGGRVHAPKPKFDQHVHTNKKEKRGAIAQLLSDKIKAEKLIILQNEQFKEPKTKKVAQFLEKLEIDDQRILFLREGGKGDLSFIRSVRNIPAADTRTINMCNGYDLTVNQGIVVFESAVDQLKELLRKGAQKS